jgi:hypothetical protein
MILPLKSVVAFSALKSAPPLEVSEAKAVFEAKVLLLEV